jgi:hypothetical protein
MGLFSVTLEKQLDMVYKEMEAFRAEGEVVKLRRYVGCQNLVILRYDRGQNDV